MRKDCGVVVIDGSTEDGDNWCCGEPGEAERMAAWLQSRGVNAVAYADQATYEAWKQAAISAGA